MSDLNTNETNIPEETSEIIENNAEGTVEETVTDSAENVSEAVEAVAENAPEAPQNVPDAAVPVKKKHHVLRTLLIVILALAAVIALIMTFSVKARIIGLGCLQLGKPYIFGDVGPDSYDCSGLTSYVYRNAAGLELGRTASMQGYDNHYEKLVSTDDLKTGDLVFFNTVRDNDRCDHVGIYIGFDTFLHASSKKEKVVISSLKDKFYKDAYTWGRRVL